MIKKYFKRLMSVAVLLAMLLLLPSVVRAQQKRDIHELFQQTAGSRAAAPASNDTIDVDLSEWESDYDTPIVIGTGLNYKFTNGVLRKKNDGTWQGGALIVVQNGSIITLGETASFDGGNFQSTDPVVEVKDGRFYVDGGSVTGVYGWVNATENTNGNTAVKLTDVEDPVLTPYLYMWRGTIVGRVDNNTETGSVILRDGTIGRLSTARDVTMYGSAKILTNLYFYRQTAKVTLLTNLQNVLRLSNYAKDQLVVVAGHYTITSSDLEKIVLGGSNASLYQLSLEEGKVYVRERNSGSQTIENVEPGTLPNRITDPDNVEELTLTGRLNGTDIVLLQEMSKKKLRKLDISGCYIVSGGSVYYTLDATGSSYYTANDEIGAFMFYQSTSLETVILPNSIKKMDGASFNYSSVKSITIGPNVSTISGGLCPGANLEEIILRNNSSFVIDGGILYDVNRTIIYRAVIGLTGEVNIPNNITLIKNSAFDNCAYITKVTLPNSLKEVETACFSDCASLTEVIFNANLTRLGYNCFSHCTSLKKVDLSNTKVDYIYQSFYGCSAIDTLLLPKTIGEIWGPSFTSKVLKYISCPATTPPTLSHADRTFAYSSIKNSCKLVVPESCISKYKAADGWKEFYNPNLITNEDELQRRLDEIAEQKPTSSVTLTIQDGGIVITKPVIAKNDCYVVITGGKITLSKNFSFVNGYERTSVFLFSGRVTLRNITIDCNSVSTPNHFMSFDGNVTISSGVTYLNTYKGDFIYGFYHGLGTLSVSSGDLSLGGTVFYPTHDGKVYVYGGIYSCQEDKQLAKGDGRLDLYGGTFTGGGIDFSGNICLGRTQPNDPVIINTGKITGSGTFEVVTSNKASVIPEIDVTNWVVTFSSQSASTVNNFKFSADWSIMELGKAFVVSRSTYSPIPQEVLDQIEFIDMPADREAYYDETDHSVKLREKVMEDDLQDYLNSFIDTEDVLTASTYTRQFRNTQWQSLYVPFSMSYDQWSPYFEVARLTGASKTDGNTQIEATLLTADDGDLLANTPCLIRAKKTGKYTISFDAPQLSEQKENTQTLDNLLVIKGNYSQRTDLKSSDFRCMLGGSLWYPTTDDYVLPPFRWYAYPYRLRIVRNSPIQVVIRDGATTGISAKADVSGQDGRHTVYDLSGRHLAADHLLSLPKGIYIIDGKKYTVK